MTNPNYNPGGPVYGPGDLGPHAGPGPYPPAPYGPPQPFVVPTSGIAVAALIMGLISVFGGFFLVIPQVAAIILGHVAARETKDGRRGGHGMAVAALITGYLVTGFTIIVVTFLTLAATSGGGT